ncbi:glycosyltransferase [Thalassospira sp. MA62]|nr:glycosyltransferase [Thalassospira sp. MA62]
MRNPMTIITTVHNGHEFIDRYSINILATLGPKDHAVIVDDGSFPTAKWPENLISDPRITILSPGRIGRGAALNLAIATAPTDQIAILDIDDQSHPERLDQQAAMLSAHPDHLIFAYAQSDYGFGRFGRYHRMSPGRLYLGNPLHHSSLAFHRDIWACIGGYDRALPCCIDLDFYLRACLIGGASMVRLNAPLIARNLDPGTRFFSAIAPEIYTQTRQDILDHYAARFRYPVWPLLARLRARLLGALP